MVDFEFPSTRMFEACIGRVENILRLVVGQVRVESELQELKNELIENRGKVREEWKEFREHNVKTTVEHALEIFKKDAVITNLQKDVTALQTKLTRTENELAELKETVNQFISSKTRRY